MYHDFPYFFCMAAISSSVFEIFVSDVVSDVSSGSRRIATNPTDGSPWMVQVLSTSNAVFPSGALRAEKRWERCL